MRKIICDRCGADITAAEKTGYISMNWRAARGGRSGVKESIRGL